MQTFHACEKSFFGSCYQDVSPVSRFKLLNGQEARVGLVYVGHLPRGGAGKLFPADQAARLGGFSLWWRKMGAGAPLEHCWASGVLSG
jgi:hypothetical protein